MSRTMLFSQWAVIGSLLLVTSCEDKKTSSQAHTDAGASADKYATADTKLTKALQAATAGSAGALEGPPPDGIFSPGIADGRHPRERPTTVELLSEGSEPRITLGGARDAGAHGERASAFGPAALELGMQTGPRVALPTIDLGLDVGPAKGDDGIESGLAAVVRRSLPAKEQPGSLPPEVERAIATLAGAELTIAVTPDGRTGPLQVKPGKGMVDELARVVHHAAEALVFATVPAPEKPVGVGAQWMAETRMPWMGLDVIAYRAFRIKSIDNNRARVALDVKAYATSKDTEIEGVPKGATLEQVDAQAQGELEVVTGEWFARRMELAERLLMVMTGPGEGQKPQAPSRDKAAENMLTAQIQAQATFARGEDLRAAARAHIAP